MKRWLTLLLCASAAVAQKPKADADPAHDLFARPGVVQVRITLDDAARQHLREKPREYATARLQLGEQQFAAVGVKLKGAAGSFREFDDGPGFTVHLGKFGGEARFHGLLRFHLNNGAQDDSRLSEWLGHEMFQAAGHPAPRVTHARVRVDDRDLGVYVLREAFDRQFLQRCFGDVHGNLYDGGFCQDIDADLEKDSGDGPDDRADLRALCELCRGVDADRAAALAEAVDLTRFLDFAALEAMLGHWDGYCQNRNNFRLWLPTGAGAVFLPHGMDQLLGDSEAAVLDHPPAFVASAVMQVPALRKRYRERLRALLPLFAPARVQARFDAVVRALEKEYATLDAERRRQHLDAARDLMQRLQDRHRALEKLVRGPEPKPQALAVGKSLQLRTWHPAAETEGVELGKKDYRGVATLMLACTGGGDSARHAAFRCNLLLAHGRYQLRAVARCEGVRADDEHGMALRVDDAASELGRGDHNWRPLRCDFAVGEFQRNVELRLDLEATAGKAWFRFDSLQLVRLPD